MCAAWQQEAENVVGIARTVVQVVTIVKVAFVVVGRLPCGRSTLLHHSGGGVDRVAEEPVPRKLRADDAGDDGAGMNTHLEQHRIGLAPAAGPPHAQC